MMEGGAGLSRLARTKSSRCSLTRSNISAIAGTHILSLLESSRGKERLKIMPVSIYETTKHDGAELLQPIRYIQSASPNSEALLSNA